ncbi:MAG: CbiX/SirB N-terminal domain-containing protein [Pseudanabaenaceae cyanobacterium bins.68]|nr:CbiX/SirB N-terminal domain-containing protein [Pseudanabaenaceae cyanobacterium bins.68]
MTTGYFLVTHGSSDPAAAQQLHDLVTLARTLYPREIVSGGCLEGLAQSLTEQLLNFGQYVGTDAQIKVIPLFLLPGAHVCEDLPMAVQLANQTSGFEWFELNSYLGQHPDIVTKLAQKFAQFPSDRRILVSHGSKLPAAQQMISSLATQLGAVPAYWSIEPKLASQLACPEPVTVLPYFLFPGKISRAIAAEVANYSHAQITDLPFTLRDLVDLSLLHPLQDRDSQQVQSQLQHPSSQITETETRALHGRTST